MSAAKVYYIFIALINIGFACTLTAYAPFLESIGLTLGQIALVNSIFWATIILAELPTGMLADGKSRAWSLKAGTLSFVIGATLYLFADDIVSASIAEIFIAIGEAFFTGAMTAWVTDALDREGKKDQVRKVFATNSIIRGSIFLVGGLVGSLIGIHNYQLIWLPFAISSLAAFFFAHKYMNGQGEPLETVTEIQAFKLSVALLTKSRALIWVSAALIIFGAVVSFNHYWALYFKPIVGQIGLGLYVWPLMSLGFIGSGMFVRRVKLSSGDEGKLITLSILLSGVGLVMIALVSGLPMLFSALIIHELGRGMFVPLTDSFVQHRIHTSYRATFGSLQSFIGRIGFAAVPFIVWLTLDGKPDSTDTIEMVWLICGVILLIGSLGLWFTRPRAK
jgi:MFS family permease